VQALLGGLSPGPGRPGSAALPTPAVQGLLRQLRISTPALGPHVRAHASRASPAL
jgi:hypothetical protein